VDLTFGDLNSLVLFTEEWGNARSKQKGIRKGQKLFSRKTNFCTDGMKRPQVGKGEESPTKIAREERAREGTERRKKRQDKI